MELVSVPKEIAQFFIGSLTIGQVQDIMEHRAAVRRMEQCGLLYPRNEHPGMGSGIKGRRTTLFEEDDAT